MGNDMGCVPIKPASTVHAILDGRRHAAMHGHLQENHREARRHMIVPRHIKRAEDYIRENLAEPLDNETLARIADVSPRSLYRGFVDFRGISPARYIQDMRLEVVHRLITAADGVRDIKSIAFGVGFRSYASFWRSFVRKFGVSPSQAKLGAFLQIERGARDGDEDLADK